MIVPFTDIGDIKKRKSKDKDGVSFWTYWTIQVETNMQNMGASLVAQMVKNLPAVQKTWVQSRGQEDPLENGITTHSSILAWRVPGTEEPSRLQSLGSQSQTRLSSFHSLYVGCS